jgi:hypothetical protein
MVMKWKEIILISFFSCSLGAAARGEKSGPWAFRNIAVVNLPTKDVEIRRALDHQSIEMRFNKWHPEVGDAIEKALSESPLSFRIHPGRQSAMVVEIYSDASDVDLASRKNGKYTQVIIGEVRGEHVTASLLSASNQGGEGDGGPISEVARLVREGKLSSAKIALHKTKTKKNVPLKFLYRTRLALIDFLKDGRSAAACPALPSVSIKGADASEALLLNAWCHRGRGQTDMALAYLKLIEQLEPTKDVLERVNTLRRIIIAGRLLAADRSNARVRVAALSIHHMDLIWSSCKERSFIETVARNLISTGIGGPLARMIQRLMSSGERKRQANLEPVLIESFLTSGQHVLALDAATYFLSKKQPSWRAARLERGLGHAVLQGGDWAGAAMRLERAKSLDAPWQTNDELALIEARLRGGHGLEDLKATLDAIQRDRRARGSHQREWLDRLAAEIDLRAGRIPSEGELSSLPDHAIFQAAAAAEAKGNEPLRRKMLKRIAGGKSGWSKLAKATLEIEDMQREFETMKSVLKVTEEPK